MDWNMAGYVFTHTVSFMAPLIVLGVLIATHKLNTKTIRRIIQKQEHIYMLMDILCSGLVVPPARDFYRKVREAGPGCDLKKLTYEASVENFTEMITKLRNFHEAVTDPAKKIQIERMIERLQGLFNLYSTLDENSSEEYCKQVWMDVQKSMQQMVSEGLAEMGGMNGSDESID